jgi:hypothetical protein
MSFQGEGLEVMSHSKANLFKYRPITLFLFFGVIIVLLMSGVPQSKAVSGDEEDDISSVARSRAHQKEPSRKKVYPGVRDEQELKVQVSIPQPSRSAEGSSELSSGGVPAPIEND